ncbi:MAG: Smr/MutS family protein [Treponema sp.]|jgi:DNA-nicking Smr family endonuclease|nr:Smr/MutS family protein [Treponema sp.]
MDFGDILDEWDRQTARTRGKKRAIEDEAAKRPNPLNAWMNRNGVWDKDAENTAGETAAWERRHRLLRKQPDAVVDLHGLTQDEAWETLEHFFGLSRERGLEKLLVIHGKGNHSNGNGVLKVITRKFIENCPFAGESGHNSGASGGQGATWVLLKETPEKTG